MVAPMVLDAAGSEGDQDRIDDLEAIDQSRSAFAGFVRRARCDVYCRTGGLFNGSKPPVMFGG